MQDNKNEDIMRIWSRATIASQQKLIWRFLREKGRRNMQREQWMAFLAEEFSIPEPV